jgi:hypothetical protein
MERFGTVYRVVFRENGFERVVYVGSTVRTVAHRASGHFSTALNTNKQGGLLDFIRKNPDRSLYAFETIEVTVNFKEREQFWMNHYGIETLLNRSPCAKSNKSPNNRTRYWLGKRPDAAIAASVLARKGVSIGKERAQKLKETRQKKVRRADTGEVFVSAFFAAKQLGVTASSISRVANGTRKTIRGITFEYVKDET